MASETVGLEEQSDLEQQQDPNGDLLKARPGGVTEPGGLVPPYDKDAATADGDR